MRTWLSLAALLFMACLGVFLTRGLDAYEAGRTAAAALTQRVDAVGRARREVSVVSHAEIDALASARAALTEIVGRRRGVLAGGPLPDERPGLVDVLERSPLRAVARNAPLRAELLAAIADQPRLEAALVRTLEAIRETQVEQLESLTLPPDGPRTVPGIPGLQAYEFELVVLSEVPEVLDLLEVLVPGRVAPVMTVSGASVRRIEPALWASAPEGLTSPPVRLWLRLEALFADPRGTSG